MKCRAAVLHEMGQQWQVEEITVDPPKAGDEDLRAGHNPRGVIVHG